MYNFFFILTFAITMLPVVACPTVNVNQVMHFTHTNQVIIMYKGFYLMGGVCYPIIKT